MLLSNLRQRLARDERGFTLIELLVVLIIIAVLLAIAVPSYLGFKDKAEARAAGSNVRAAVPAVEAYYSEATSYVGMTIAKLQEQDQAVKLSTAPTNLSGSTYCIQSVVGNFTAWKLNPGGDVTIGAKGVAAPAPC
jgi:prepilin-type N-terminal cleavage/methylation domain-containing protein